MNEKVYMEELPMALRVTEEMRKALIRISKIEGTNKSVVARRALEKYISEYEFPKRRRR